MHLLVLQLLFFVFHLWGGSHTGRPSPTANAQAQISGRIIDRLGCPMIATVRLRAPVDHTLQEVRSDMDGRFTFPNVAAGHYWIAFELQPSAGAGGVDVDVTDAATYKEIRWPEPKKQTWDGSVVVTDAEGTALPGASVAWRRYSGGVDGPSCETATGVTDVHGRAHVTELLTGTYRVVATANGFVSETGDVTIGYAQKRTVTVRLLTPVESERRSRTVHVACESSSPPETLRALVSGSDAIVVGHIRTAVLDPDYTATGTHPSVRTRYNVELTDVIKPHAHLPTTAQSVVLMQSAGELDWGKDVLVGCSQKTMRPGEIYVLFLTWNDQLRTFVPWRGNGLLADITSDSVAPFRVLNTPAAIIDAHTGQSASDFIRDIRAVIRGADCLSYEPAEVALQGMVLRDTILRSPNDESVSRGNTTETFWVLQLLTPICVAAKPTDNGLYPAAADVRRVQLDVDLALSPRFESLLGTRVSVSGTLFAPHTGHHHTAVLLSVADVKPLGTEK